MANELVILNLGPTLTARYTMEYERAGTSRSSLRRCESSTSETSPHCASVTIASLSLTCTAPLPPHDPKCSSAARAERRVGTVAQCSASATARACSNGSEAVLAASHDALHACALLSVVEGHGHGPPRGDGRSPAWQMSAMTESAT